MKDSTFHILAAASAVILTATVLSCVAVVTGCRTVTVEKHDPIIQQINSNEWVVAEGGWEARYRSYGLWTNFGELSITLSTNGVKSVTLKDLNSDVSTNHVAIITASGGTAADVAKAIVEALK